MVLDTPLINTEQYQVRIKGKVEQSKERSSALNVVAIEKEAFWSLSTTITSLWNTNDFHKIIWFQVVLSNSNNFQSIMRFQCAIFPFLTYL